MSNSKTDTWPLQVRSKVDRKACMVGPGSTGWRVHRRDWNSAQGSTHLDGKGVWLQLRVKRGSITGSSYSHPHFRSLGRAVKGLGVHSPNSTILPPEGVGRALGELVQVPTVLPRREECAQLCVHVTEDEGQLGQLSPAGKSYECPTCCRENPYRCKASRFPLMNQCTKSPPQFSGLSSRHLRFLIYEGSVEAKVQPGLQPA